VLDVGVGINNVDDYALGYIALEEKTLQPLTSPLNAPKNFWDFEPFFALPKRT